MYTFSSKDTYKVSHQKKNEKFSIDYKVLLRLYEPIIGCVAMSLYLTLESEVSLNKSSRVYLDIARLHKVLQVNDKQFNDAVETLKEYKLLSIKANPKRADDYLFVLHQTKSAVEFLNDKKLNNSLQVIVDDGYYKQVYNYFITNDINEDEYVDIDEIKLSNELTEEEFYQQLYDKIPIFNDKAINNQVKKEINRLKQLFKITYNDVEKVLLQSVFYENDQLTVDLKKLNDLIEKEFNKNTVESNSDNNLAKLFENERSITYYKKLSGRDSLLPRETEMIDELLDQYQISEGVLNVVIDYYFKHGKNTMGVPKNYFKKIIEEMIINNVKTTVDAMNYFRNRSKRVQNYKDKVAPVVKKEVVKEVKEDVNSEIDQDTLDEFRRLMGG